MHPVRAEWEYGSDGAPIGARVRGQHFTFQAGETPEQLIDRARSAVGATQIAHWIMLTPTDAQL